MHTPVTSNWACFEVAGNQFRGGVVAQAGLDLHGRQRLAVGNPDVPFLGVAFLGRPILGGGMVRSGVGAPPGPRTACLPRAGSRRGGPRPASVGKNREACIGDSQDAFAGRDLKR